MRVQPETPSRGAASLIIRMFAQQQPERKRWRLSHVASLIVHSVVVFVMVKPPAPIFIKPVSIALGNWGKSTTLYLPSQALMQAQTTAREEKPLIYVRAPKQIAPHGKTKPKVKPEQKIRDVEVVEN